MEIKTRWAQDREGKVIPFATASLFYEGTTDLVSGIEDKDGNPLSNPFQADVNGKVVFAAPDGQYDIKFSEGQRESTASVQFLDVSGALQVAENMDALRSITGNSGRDYILVKFHTSDGDGGGGDFYWSSGAAAGTYVDNNGTIIVPTGGDGSAAWLRESGGVQADIVLAVPSAFPTPQAALDSVRNIRPLRGAQFSILLESGYQLPDGTRNDGSGRYATFLCADGDFSHIQIRSADAVVPVVSTFSGSVIRNVAAKGIVLNCLIDMGGRGQNGYSAEDGSTGKVVANGSGVINAGEIGLYSRQNSAINAAVESDTRWPSWGSGVTGVNFSGAGVRGCYTNHTARAYIRGGNFSGCAGTAAVWANHAATIDAAEVDASDSTIGFFSEEGSNINARNGIATGCGTGVQANENSNVNAYLANLSGCDNGVVAIQASTVNADIADISGCGRSIRAVGSSTINAYNANCADATDGTGVRGAIAAAEGSTINCEGVTATGGAGRGITAVRGARINASGADLSGSAKEAIYASDGAQVNFGSGTADGCGGTNGSVIAVQGARVDAYQASVKSASSAAFYTSEGEIRARGADASNAGTYAFHTERGGIMISRGATTTGAGTAATNVPVNEISADGIIFG